MREIKFRGWLPKTKVMVTFHNPHINFEYGLLAFNNNHEDYSGIANMPDDYEEAIFMQYTGLKDKNGKEIYESDIVEFIDDKWTTGRKTIRVEIKWIDYKNFDGWWVSYLEDVEVIGNIHQNPELLKEHHDPA